MSFESTRRLLLLATFGALLISSCAEREDDGASRGLFAPDENGSTNLTSGSESNVPACKARVTPSNVLLGQKFSVMFDVYGLASPIDVVPSANGPMPISIDQIEETRFLGVYRMHQEFSSGEARFIDATGRSLKCQFPTKLVLQ